MIIAFQVLEKDEPSPLGYKRIPYHFIFDVKHDFTRKARLVAGGNRNPDVAPHLSYSSVASRERVSE